MSLSTHLANWVTVGLISFLELNFWYSLDSKFESFFHGKQDFKYYGDQFTGLSKTNEPKKLLTHLLTVIPIHKSILKKSMEFVTYSINLSLKHLNSAYWKKKKRFHSILNALVTSSCVPFVKIQRKFEYFYRICFHNYLEFAQCSLPFLCKIAFLPSSSMNIKYVLMDTHKTK